MVSVANSVVLPAVLSVTIACFAPESAAVNAMSPGSTALVSLLVSRSVPRNPGAGLPLLASTVSVTAT